MPAAAGRHACHRRAPLRARRGAGAFSLLEILLMLALLALLAGGLVTGAAHLVDSRATTPEDIFWEAARAARKTALTAEADVTLRFDAKERAFVLAGPRAEQRFELPVAGELTVDFLQAQTGNSAVLIGGQLVETKTLPLVTFYADGTCTAFRVQFRANGPARTIAIDPWTCAPVLATGDGRNS